MPWQSINRYMLILSHLFGMIATQGKGYHVEWRSRCCCDFWKHANLIPKPASHRLKKCLHVWLISQRFLQKESLWWVIVDVSWSRSVTVIYCVDMVFYNKILRAYVLHMRNKEQLIAQLKRFWKSGKKTEANLWKFERYIPSKNRPLFVFYDASIENQVTLCYSNHIKKPISNWQSFPVNRPSHCK